MRKAKFLIAVIIILSVFMLTTVCANAKTLSVKNAWFFGKDCVVVLREDGDLLLGNSVDVQTPKLLVKDVVDFKKRNYGGVGIYSLKGIALHKNGDVTTIDYNTTNNNLETETIKASAIEVCLVNGELAYIDKNYTLNTIINDDIITTDNIKKVVSSGNIWAYIISPDDTLYRVGSYITNESERVELMSNVKDGVSLTSYEELVLRNNGDLYIIRYDDDVATRIGTGVEKLDDVSFCSHTPTRDIMYVNNIGELYYGNSSPNSTFRKCMDNVKEAKFGYSCQKYVVTNDNILYLFPQLSNIDVNSKTAIIYMGVEKIYLENKDRDLIGVSKNNDLYLVNGKYTDFYMSDVKNAIKYEELGNDNDRYLFIKSNGELWGAFSDSKTSFDRPTTPFLSSFCQKQTKVKINQKEIELTAKIQMVDNRSMYPFRECLENMGATVLWDATNQIAIGEYNGITIEFPVGKNEYYINGVHHEMDTKSYIDESIGRTYIPIRYAAEGLGFTVDWIEGEAENIIAIYK